MKKINNYLCSMRMSAAIRFCSLLAMFVLMTTSARAGYLYVLNETPAVNTIYGYSVDEASGALTPLPGFPVATGGSGVDYFNSELLTIDRKNYRLYVINDGSDNVSAFSINPASGALRPLPFSPIPLPVGRVFRTIAVHPSGSPLVVGNADALSHSFVITPTAATPAAGSPYSITPADAHSSVFSQDGLYFYTGGSSRTEFAGFSVNAATGVLTTLPGSPFSSGSNLPVAYATDAGDRLFLANVWTGQVRSFQMISGIPTPAISNPTISGYLQATDGALHPDGKFYVVADRNGNRVGSFQIAGVGTATTLTAVPGSPFASGGSLPNAIAFNKAGTFLFAINGTSRNITTYSFDSGRLTVSRLQPSNTLGKTGLLTGIDYLSAVDNDGGQTPSKADLVVTDAKISLSQSCQPGNPVLMIDVVVKNIGGTLSPARSDVGLVGTIDIDGSGWGNGVGLPSIAPGAMARAAIPIFYLTANPAHLRGRHEFKVFVNRGNWVEETNTDNNTFSRTVPIVIPEGFCKSRKQ